MLNKKIYDLPKIGPLLRKWKYRNIFNLKPGEVAIDLGANIGKVTKRMIKPEVFVYAFEPDPNAFSILQENLREFPNVNLLNKAVSDHAGQANFYFNDRYSEDPVKWSVASTLHAGKPHVDKENYVEVEVIDIADFIKAIDKPVGLLKIDIEGEEVRVLNRMIDLGLTKSVRKIIVETHERFPTLEEPTKTLIKRIKAEKLRNIDLNWA